MPEDDDYQDPIEGEEYDFYEAADRDFEMNRDNNAD